MTTPNKDMQVQHPASGNVELAQDRPVYSPDTDIYEKEDGVLVLCDMPGVDEKHVDVTLENDVLTLTGYQQVEDPSGYDPVYWGFRPGVFRRSFTLSTAVDRAGIKARIRNGVLQVNLPKAEEAQPKKIRVETA